MSKIVVDEVDTIHKAIELFQKITVRIMDDELKIDFENTKNMRNHYLAIIGMGIEVIINRGVIVEILPPKNKTILNSMNRIGFLAKFMCQPESNKSYKSMINYTNIPLTNNDLAQQEFSVHFLERFSDKVVNLSPRLKKLILKKIFELFSNVFRHSESELGLFCAGQFYAQRKRFIFTIVDNGVTIKKNVNKFLTKESIKKRNTIEKIIGTKIAYLNSVEAIKWALEDKNSSTGAGGLGLSLLMDLFKLRGGNIEIISNDGYYSVKDGVEDSYLLPKMFEGTIINIELNTNTDVQYVLKEELDEKNQC